MAQESFYNLRSKIVELFAANLSITSSQVEVVMKAVAQLEYKLGASKERVPSMEHIDLMLYGNRLQTVDAGPTDEMQKEGVDLQKVSACRIDWACAYGKAARAREEAEYLTTQEQRLRVHLDKLIT